VAQLFIQDDSSQWTLLDLERDRYQLHTRKVEGTEARTNRRPPQVDADHGGPLPGHGALLLSHSRAPSSSDEGTLARSEAEWVLLTSVDAKLRINSVPVAIGIATLRHRDQVCLDGGAPIYFSTERLARIEAYEGSDSPRCPRCASPIQSGDLVVCCPGCDVLYHQRSDRECFSYSETCALCDQSSDLTAGFRWSPEYL
jgi:hypothetical protein